MAPIRFGLDMAEFKWSKFGTSYMFGNQDYHLRRTRLVVYQLAMILCVFSNSLGTAALSNYIDQQDYIQGHYDGASEYNNDYIGASSYNMFCSIFIAFVFGGAFFIDLIWPERQETRGILRAWEACAIAASIFITADVIALTVIVSSRSAYVTGMPQDEVMRAVSAASGYSLIYKDNGRAVASLVFLWLGFPAVIASTMVLFMSHSHDRKYGDPWSTGARKAQGNDSSGSPDVVLENGNRDMANDSKIAEPQATAASPTYPSTNPPGHPQNEETFHKGT